MEEELEMKVVKAELGRMEEMVAALNSEAEAGLQK